MGMFNKRARLAAAVGDLAPARIRFTVGHIPETGPDPETEVKKSAPEVRAEHVRQVNELLLPRLRSDMKALRLDTAQHLTRLAEVMAELERIDGPGEPSSEPGEDERLV